MNWGLGCWGLGDWGGQVGGIVGQLEGQLTEAQRRQRNFQAQRATLRNFPGLLQDQSPRAPLQQLEYQRQAMRQVVGQSYPLGSWAGKIEREVLKHCPSKSYECFVQKQESRNSYMCRITHERRGKKSLVAEVDVPNELLRYPNRGEWKVELLNDLSDDIAARGR